jgi:hypothetical protein
MFAIEMPVQAILFDPNVYSMEEAEDWLAKHNFVPLKPGELEGKYIHFRIADPKDFESSVSRGRFRTKQITEGIKFVFAWKEDENPRVGKRVGCGSC